MFGNYPISVFSLVSAIGPQELFRRVMEQTWGEKVFLGLRCDLMSLPPIRPAKFEVTMRPCDSTSFTGFHEEYAHVRGEDCFDVVLRLMMCAAGVQTLYVATAPDGAPAYAQWLVTSSDQDRLHSHQPGRYPHLSSDEVLLEGSYTFSRSRRTGVMSNGMAQLLRIAQAGGPRYAITYVAADNVPALRGCANVGFALDHVRRNVRRFGFRQSLVLPIDGNASRIWSVATAPHSAV